MIVGLGAIVGLAAISAAWLGPAARRMPLLVAVPTLLLLVVEWRRFSRPGSADEKVDPRESELLAWLAGLVATTWALGVLVGPPLFLATYLRWRSREPWHVVMLLSAGLWLATFVVLDRVLHLPVTGVLQAWWLS